MGIDERRRHELYLGLEEVLGPERATTLMDQLPPVPWTDVATKQDLAELRAATKQDVAELRAATKHDLAELRAATKQDVAELRADVRRSEESTRKDLEIMEYKLMAAISNQARAMFLAIVSIVLTMSGLTFALAH